QESYEAILSYALEAIQHLPDLPIVATRPSKWAAHALLARAYLSMRMYSEALSQAELALQIKSDLIDFNNPQDGINILAGVPFIRLNKETIFYSEMNRHFFVHLPAYGAAVDTVLFTHYYADDLRTKAFFS